MQACWGLGYVLGAPSAGKYFHVLLQDFFYFNEHPFKVPRPSGPNYWIFFLNGYALFSVKNIVQNVKLIELWDKHLVPLHFVISKS